MNLPQTCYEFEGGVGGGERIMYNSTQSQSWRWMEVNFQLRAHVALPLGQERGIATGIGEWDIACGAF